jgi:putative endonuclease
MYFVYTLRSESHPNQFYYGLTRDLKTRVKSHNFGQSKHTSKYRPWALVWFGCFQSKTQAEEFEKYLKTASGKAFARKRLI